MNDDPFAGVLEKWHREKRKQGWKCTLASDHYGPCPMVPIIWRRPILWWRMKHG